MHLACANSPSIKRAATLGNRHLRLLAILVWNSKESMTTKSSLKWMNKTSTGRGYGKLLNAIIYWIAL
ncbi:predicted protein [Lichtheimia corymbifera JMRC:FSU:9682]|uniref:Uncharacterized protein n=1 Tax=Lichtheimia corymbifera JMRC:FSU:9682 TaxID=1263082 RepID=A0A068RZ21_9FUNG|nr:predicted protein [Lichtheimia corymbifera JMRC:FSU:9682]